MHTAPYFAAFGLLIIFHAMRIVRLRWRHRVAFGDGGNADLAMKIRIFGNFTEYVPMALVMLIALEIVQSPVWYMHLCGTTMLLGRTMHAIGLDRGPGPGQAVPFGRFYGMILTFISMFLSSMGVLIWTFLDPSA